MWRDKTFELFNNWYHNWQKKQEDLSINLYKNLMKVFVYMKVLLPAELEDS